MDERNRFSPDTLRLLKTDGHTIDDRSSYWGDAECILVDPKTNERLGGQPVLVVHQPTSDTTTAFVARAGGRTLTFKAANPSATEMTDEQTGSRWNAYGACSAGPMQGVTLEPLILEPEYWFAWSEFHRGTKIYGAPRLP